MTRANLEPIAQALLSFRDNKSTLLLATPSAARGLDLPALSHVYNVGAPEDATAYLHRAGRAGRIGSTVQHGVVTTIVSPEQLPALQEMVRVCVCAGRRQGCAARVCVATCSGSSQLQTLHTILPPSCHQTTSPRPMHSTLHTSKQAAELGVQLQEVAAPGAEVGAEERAAAAAESEEIVGDQLERLRRNLDDTFNMF